MKEYQFEQCRVCHNLSACYKGVCGRCAKLEIKDDGDIFRDIFGEDTSPEKAEE